MNNFDNHIYMTICEVSFDLFRETDFVTYTRYCNAMNLSLQEGKLSSRDKYHLIKIIDRLDAIFCLEEELTNKYVTDYFALGEYNKFEMAVRMTKEHFPFIGNF